MLFSRRGSSKSFPVELLLLLTQLLRRHRHRLVIIAVQVGCNKPRIRSRSQSLGLQTAGLEAHLDRAGSRLGLGN